MSEVTSKQVIDSLRWELKGLTAENQDLNERIENMHSDLTSILEQNNRYYNKNTELYNENEHLRDEIDRLLIDIRLLRSLNECGDDYDGQTYTPT